MKDTILNLLFPPRCAVCGEILEKKSQICAVCEKELPFITGKICRRCGAEKELCICSAEFNSYDAVCAPFHYEGNISAAVYRIKRSHDLYSAKILSKYLFDTVQKRYAKSAFDYIIPVPLHVWKQRRKGYNHSELLAKQLSKLSGVPLLTKCLYRSRLSLQQKKLTRFERLMNIGGAFAVRNGSNLSGKKILLVDDVKTTGATLNECAKALKRAGAEKVCCACLAITPRQTSNDKMD